MKIEMWADIVCPICGLTEHRLEQALARFEHSDEVEVVHRSFLLHPDLPREGMSQVAMAALFGVDERGIHRSLDPIEAAAEAEGLSPYRALDRTLGPTDYAHELLAFAAEKGKGEEAWRRMFREHFGKARKFWTLEEVAAFAPEIGLDEDEAREALSSRRYRERVQADHSQAVSLGATGTPFMVIDGTYGVTGGRDTETLLALLRQAWQELHPERRIVPLDDVASGLCTPDSCAV